MTDFLQDITDKFMLIAIIFLGAISHSTMLLITARKKQERFTWTDALTNAIVAAFGGMMFSLGASLLTESQALIGLITGVGTVSGMVGINLLTTNLLSLFTDVVKARLGITNSSKNEK